jgi:hypothetical protein
MKIGRGFYYAIAMATVFSVGLMNNCFADSLSKRGPDTLFTIPLGGNTWRTDADTIGGQIGNNGIVNWTNPNAKFTAYLRIVNKGKFKLWLRLKVAGGKSRITVSALKSTKTISLTSDTLRTSALANGRLVIPGT